MHHGLTISPMPIKTLTFTSHLPCQYRGGIKTTIESSELSVRSATASWAEITLSSDAESFCGA